MARIASGQEAIIPIARQATPVRQTTTRVHVRRYTKTTVLYIFALIILLIMVLPYCYLMLQSLAPWTEVDKTFIPSSLTLRSYVWIWTGGSFEPQPWLQGLFNSLPVSTANTVSAGAPDAINHGGQTAQAQRQPPTGPEGLRRVFKSLLIAFPDRKYTLEDVIATEDKMVCRLTVSGTHQGMPEIPVEGGMLMNVPRLAKPILFSKFTSFVSRTARLLSTGQFETTWD